MSVWLPACSVFFLVPASSVGKGCLCLLERNKHAWGLCLTIHAGLALSGEVGLKEGMHGVPHATSGGEGDRGSREGWHKGS